MRYTIKHIFNTDIDTFWDKIFFDREYNDTLFKQHLGFTVYDVLELEKKDDGSVTRRVRGVPKAEIPAAVKKVLGDSAGYTEVGRFDPKARRFHVEVIPNTAADKIKTKLAMWVEPRGDEKVERFVEVDNQVKIFGVGKMVESVIEKQTRDNYGRAADFTNKWIADKGLG